MGLGAFVDSLEEVIDIGATRSLDREPGAPPLSLDPVALILPMACCNGGRPEPPGNFSLNEAALEDRTDLPIGAAFAAIERPSMRINNKRLLLHTNRRGHFFRLIKSKCLGHHLALDDERRTSHFIFIASLSLYNVSACIFGLFLSYSA
jgi:hypothetical protein